MRRIEVAEEFPNDAAVVRLITAVCVETHDKWSASERRCLYHESMNQLKRGVLHQGPAAPANIK